MQQQCIDELVNPNQRYAWLGYIRLFLREVGASSLKNATNKQIIQVMVLDPMLAAGQVVEVAKQFEIKFFLVGVTQPSVINKQIRKEQVTNIMIWYLSTSRCCCQCQCLCLLAYQLFTAFPRFRNKVWQSKERKKFLVYCFHSQVSTFKPLEQNTLSKDKYTGEAVFLFFIYRFAISF